MMSPPGSIKLSGAALTLLATIKVNPKTSKLKEIKRSPQPIKP